MGRKAVSEATKWQIVGMKDGSMISYTEIARRLKISENCVRNTLKTFKRQVASNVMQEPES